MIITTTKAHTPEDKVLMQIVGGGVNDCIENSFKLAEKIVVNVR